MKTTLKQIGIILLVSGFLALAANLVHPRKIAWVQDWPQAMEAGGTPAGREGRE